MDLLIYQLYWVSKSIFINKNREKITIWVCLDSFKAAKRYMRSQSCYLNSLLLIENMRMECLQIVQANNNSEGMLMALFGC